jgi:hypothetical protein
MKARTRDNLIYLAAGLGVAALWAAYFFYADSHGRKMWLPSRFASRSIYTTILFWYVIIRTSRQARLSFFQILASVLFATFLHLTIFLSCRQIVDQLPTIAFWPLWVIELYLITYATEKSVNLIGMRR